MTIHCGHHVSINETHDAAYCSDCDIWVDGVCGDPECEFCRDRPEKPSEAKKE